MDIRQLLRVAGRGLILFAVTTAVHAGILRIQGVEDLSTANITITFASGATSTFTVDEGNATSSGNRHADEDDNSGGKGNGNLKILLGTTAVEATIKKVDVDYQPTVPGSMVPPPRRSRTVIIADPYLGTMISALEPFDFPTFTGGPVLAVIDLATLLTEGAAFANGQQFDVVGGQIGGHAAFTFKDITGLNPGDPLDDAAMAALTPYDGMVEVASVADIVPLPEPGRPALAALAALAAVMAWRKRPPRAVRPRTSRPGPGAVRASS